MIIKPEAEADLAGAKEWYERQREGLGDDFLERVEQVLHGIERTPLMHQAVYGEVRRAFLRRFPYAVYYQVEGGEVVVFAVIYNRRDPRTWQSRA